MEIKIEDYPLKVVSATTLFAAIMIFGIITLDEFFWKTVDLMHILFPKANEYHLHWWAILWVAIGILLAVMWKRDYRDRKVVIGIIYGFALIGLATLTMTVVSGGGLLQSPFSAFFPVAIAISIMSTSEWWHVAIFSTFTVGCVILTWRVSSSSLDAHLVASYYMIFIAALVIGAVVGSFKLAHLDDD